LPILPQYWPPAGVHVVDGVQAASLPASIEIMIVPAAPVVGVAPAAPADPTPPTVPPAPALPVAPPVPGADLGITLAQLAAAASAPVNAHATQKPWGRICTILGLSAGSKTARRRGGSEVCCRPSLDAERSPLFPSSGRRGVMETIAARAILVSVAVALSSCNGNEIGNCPAVYPQGSYCWEGVTRDSCDSQGGQFTHQGCAELGYGCRDVQQFQAASVCVGRCGAANLHIAGCAIDAFLDCSESGALVYSSCVLACATADNCDDLRPDPLTFCNAECAQFDAGLTAGR
jgi:hypothetical protein